MGIILIINHMAPPGVCLPTQGRSQSQLITNYNQKDMKAKLAKNVKSRWFSVFTKPLAREGPDYCMRMREIFRRLTPSRKPWNEANAKACLDDVGGW